LIEMTKIAMDTQNILDNIDGVATKQRKTEVHFCIIWNLAWYESILQFIARTFHVRGVKHFDAIPDDVNRIRFLTNFYASSLLEGGEIFGGEGFSVNDERGRSPFKLLVIERNLTDLEYGSEFGELNDWKKEIRSKIIEAGDPKPYTVIHATGNQAEVNENLAAIRSFLDPDFIPFGRRKVWNGMSEVLAALDEAGVRWAILRNWNDISDHKSFNFETVGEQDIDILVENKIHAAEVMKVLPGESSRFLVRGANKASPDLFHEVEFGLKEVGGGYYPSKEWEEDMLASRIRFESGWKLNVEFGWRLSEEQTFFSLLYHATVQKVYATSEKDDFLCSMISHREGGCYSLLGKEEIRRRTLGCWMVGNMGYKWEEGEEKYNEKECENLFR